MHIYIYHPPGASTRTPWGVGGFGPGENAHIINKRALQTPLWEKILLFQASTPACTITHTRQNMDMNII